MLKKNRCKDVSITHVGAWWRIEEIHELGMVWKVKISQVTETMQSISCICPGALRGSVLARWGSRQAVPGPSQPPARPGRRCPPLCSGAREGTCGTNPSLTALRVCQIALSQGDKPSKASRSSHSAFFYLISCISLSHFLFSCFGIILYREAFWVQSCTAIMKMY